MRRAAWGRAVRRLVEHELLDGQAIFAGRVTVDLASRSNHVAIVRSDDRAVLVLKRHRVAIDDVDPLTAELAVNRWLASDPATASLAPQVRLAADDVIAFEAVPDAQPFGDALATSSSEHTSRLLSALGRELGKLHARRCDDSSLPVRRPWIFGLTRGVLPEILVGDPEIAAMAVEIDNSPVLRSALQEFERTWTPSVPCHGDIKFDNVMLGDDGRSTTLRRIWLLDWELAGLGMPVWDLAGLLDGFIVPALLSHVVTSAREEAMHARPALSAHRRTVGHGASADPRQLTLATVVRLVQSALQLCAMRPTPNHRADSARRVLRGAEALARESGVANGDPLACVA